MLKQLINASKSSGGQSEICNVQNAKYYVYSEVHHTVYIVKFIMVKLGKRFVLSN